MSDQRPGHTLMDLVAILISPMLIMLMVGSLVFFLIEVLYAGKYSERLVYTFFFFVIGAVLIARISIEQGSSRAGIYAAGLGLACFLAMLRFVEYPTKLLEVLGPILNLLLMGLVWWSAHRLTWDCTHLDEDRKASGRGLLAATGLEDHREPLEDEQAETDPTAKKGKQSKEPGGLIDWWERWQKYREAEQKKPHTPGTWVLYFGLAALPLFALGQSLIPADDGGRRRATFLQMAVYVGSALALLVTTTLFGLRKYLDERNAKIPAVLTLGWLGLGGGLILVFLVAASVLPRPHSETPLFTLQKGGKLDRNASKNAVVKDKAAGQGDGAKGQKTEAGDGKSNAKGGKSGGSQGQKQAGDGQGENQGGKQSNGETKGKNKSDEQKNNPNGPNKADPGEKGSKSNQSEQSGEKTDGGEAEQTDGEESESDNSGNDSGSSTTAKLSQALESLGSFIKWVVWIIIAIAIIAGLIWFFLKGLAPFTKWAQDLLNWLRNLFSWSQSEPEVATSSERSTSIPRTPPFSAFSNPFTDGTAGQRDPAELVRYTFAALDAWAWDHEIGREPDETAMEFVVRLGQLHEAVEEPAFHLAELYSRTLYSTRRISRGQIQPLETLWDALETTTTTTRSR